MNRKFTTYALDLIIDETKFQLNRIRKCACAPVPQSRHSDLRTGMSGWGRFGDTRDCVTPKIEGGVDGDTSSSCNVS